ncbi:MAG: aminomethyl-transferring glycine dehydrogenase subunit GcvPA [Muribaculaceae bacterium]
MNHRYFPHTQEDISDMLARCGVASLDDLYADVPSDLKLNRDYNLPTGMSEKEVRDFFDRAGRRNRRLTCFAGAGFYDRYSPAAAQSIVSRSEFLTAYTPYQPEVSQGTLQYIFEYQSLMSSLTGLPISNASMYDGATATAEAAMMAVAAGRKRRRILVSETVNPATRRVVETYARYHGITIETIKAEDGVTSRSDFEEKVAAPDVAGVIVASPNYYGILEDYTDWADTCHANKALLIFNCIAADLGVIKSPGEWGADIAAGDAQSLGIPLNYGGPYLGFLCSTEALMRKMPGRIVGATVDADGRRSFVLTLQAREQHIRREKATSNICSNQGLMALYVTVYLSLTGPKGLREINEASYAGAHYLADRLTATGRARLTYPDRPFLNEFAVTLDAKADDVLARALDHDILAGVKLDEHTLLIAVTEMQTRAEIDKLVEIIK